MVRQTTKSYYALGTRITLTAKHPDPGGQLARAIGIIGRYEALLSANLASSEVSRVNQSAGIEPVEVSPAAYGLIREAVLVSRSGKGFNAAIGPLVQLWRIGFDDARRPSSKAIETCLGLSDPNRIVFDDDKRSVFLERPGMRLDLGAIAKGFIADAIKQAWADAGVERGVIDLGGNIATLGQGPRPDGRWRIGVQTPFAERGRPLGVLTLPACSAVTSGVYERVLKARGGDWHHILDPRTGYPLRTDLLGVTAITALSTTAEIWSTIGFCNGPQATLQMVPAGLRVGFVFVFDHQTVRLCPGELAADFTLIDDGYQVTQSQALG